MCIHIQMCIHIHTRIHIRVCTGDVRFELVFGGAVRFILLCL